MTVTLGPAAPLTKEEKELITRMKQLEEENPMLFHQCSDFLPTADQVPKDAKERQVWTCPGNDKAPCGAKYRLHYMDGLKHPLDNDGKPDVKKAPVSEKQVSWVRIS